MRKAFSFYRSHYEQMKLLNKTQIADITMAICEVQFLEVHINDIKFKDKMTHLVWTGIKHAIDASVVGYGYAKKDIEIPLEGGLEILQPPHQQEQGEEEEEEKEQEEEEYTYAFSLKKLTAYDNLSEEYKTNLYGACMLVDGKESRYDDFIISLRSNGYKYKNFPLAYMNWDKERAYKKFTTEPEPKFGEDWQRVILDGGGILAINIKTYETKRGEMT